MPPSSTRINRCGHQVQPEFFISILLTCVTITTSLVLNGWSNIIPDKMTGYRNNWAQPWSETNSLSIPFTTELAVYLYADLNETTCIREVVVEGMRPAFTQVEAALTFSYPNASVPFDHEAAENCSLFNRWEGLQPEKCVHLWPEHSKVSVSIVRFSGFFIYPNTIKLYNIIT